MDLYKVKKVKQPHNICVSVPGSKSITNRALLLAAMGDGTCILDGVLFSEDSRVFMQALIDLGFSITIDESNARVTIQGIGGAIPCSGSGKEVDADIYVGSAGTAARFLTAYLGLSKGRFRVNASEQMKKRPMKELLCALEYIGARIDYEEETYHFPFVIGFESLKSNSVKINIDKSSQFLSALLIAKRLLPEDFQIQIEGSHGMKYVEMTQKMIADFKGTNYKIEPDLSAACYFYAMGALLNVDTLVQGVYFDSLQGDIAFLDVLKEMGASLKETKDGIQLIPPTDGLNGGTFNLSDFSDQALTLAAIAPFAKNAVRITHIAHIRFQECDRIHAIMENLTALGIKVEEEQDGIVIYPGQPHAATIHTYEDHRVAMAFAIPGLLIDTVMIENPLCCKKTFEHYFDYLERYVY